MAHHDSLTGLGNRVHFRDQLVRALGRIDEDGGNLALMFMDLDQFKLINDTLGHRVGDLLLSNIGDRLKQTLSDDETVARLGGDEFAVIQIGKKPEETTESRQQHYEGHRRSFRHRRPSDRGQLQHRHRLGA